MFKVKDNETGEIFTVYAIQGGAFLIFRKLNDQDMWLWEPMGKFIPIEPAK